MWFKHQAWIPVAWVLAAANVGAVWFAAVPGEPMHATIHALLGVGCALGARHLSTRRLTGSTAAQLDETMDQTEALAQSTEDMQARVLELEERLDFAERLLVKNREAEHQDARPGNR